MGNFMKSKKYKIDPRKASTVEDCLLLIQVMLRYISQTPFNDKTMGFVTVIESEEFYEQIKHLIIEEV